MTAAIRLDVSCSSVVAVCHHSGCPWRAIEFDRLSATAAAAEHEQRSHPDSTQARATLRKAVERLHSSNVTPRPYN